MQVTTRDEQYVPPDHYIDGVDFIDIGAYADTALGKLLGWYTPSPKVLHDGRQFYMYAGYHYYLITQGEHLRLLKATRPEDLRASKQYTWENVAGLETHLQAALTLNLMNNAFITATIKSNRLPIYWRTGPRALRNAERRWLRVVRRTLKRIQST